MASFAEQLKAQRKEFNMPQEELAALSGISERTIRDFEKGKLSISLEKFLMLAEVLGFEVRLEKL
ncbi:helix-turn-helix domain-containing protein [uncultured Rothia sp.]|mgnify:CR=1 FL=1|uniref:helix-turn-helix domain-containing protein n=1 Tax=uncultured Rothia sp. TaxID=316088 RepID=UPI003217D0C1